MKYNELEMTPAKAFIHLMLMFCLNDDELQGNEPDNLSNYLTYFELNDTYDISEEINLFLRYKNSISNYSDYFSFLLSQLDQRYSHTLYLAASEFAVADGDLTDNDNMLLDALASVLEIEEYVQNILKHAIIGKKILKGSLY